MPPSARSADDPGWLALSPVALSAVCLAPVLWIVAGLALLLGFLVPLALAAIVLAPVAGARLWGGCAPCCWLCGHYWYPWLWSWVCRSWVRWPRLCRRWLGPLD